MNIHDFTSQSVILFEVISGSNSFGLVIPTSHADLKAGNKEYDELLEKAIQALTCIRVELYQ
ncbi:hypothetical protein [Flavobacterium sp. FPG59]|uniref:hypothetical protein n=1 Tax=Flavobacterium sp. FPG59 TaxID=1929267 RepID=UPI000A3CEBFF|nr:hypothetical protein [Flavobacterium sp. FPG59]OUD32647.1 hypothetical protein FPG59_14350 [Flavobacterium sp. FPG59]